MESSNNKCQKQGNKVKEGAVQIQPIGLFSLSHKYKSELTLLKLMKIYWHQNNIS